jgi:hypothetical protein
MGLDGLRHVQDAPQPLARGGMRTAMISSQALAEARRWLTGQMPQTRAMSEGISVYGLPSQNFSKPRTCVTCSRASLTWPSSSRCSVILPCPSTRVTGLIVIVAISVIPRSGSGARRAQPNRNRAVRSGVRPSHSSFST